MTKVTLCDFVKRSNDIDMIADLLDFKLDFPQKISTLPLVFRMGNSSFQNNLGNPGNVTKTTK